jgi:hypothetical protein
LTLLCGGWFQWVCVYYLLTTKSRFMGCGGIVADIVAVAIKN